jgi:hypothetical protein
MSIRDAVIRAIAVGAAAIPALMGGCVSTSGDVQGTRLNDNLVVYAPFDNERDWGPSYLLDAPDHHFGDEVRIGDSRSNSQVTGTAPADPSKPPLNSGQPQPQPQPLP